MTPAVERHTDLRALLEAVEAAPPVDAVEVLARELGAMIGATDVTFLIADFSGDALIRFGSVIHEAAAVDGSDALSTVRLKGSPYEEAIFSQRVSVRVGAGSECRVYAPVTDRGDALGVLELLAPQVPDTDVLAFIASAAHALAYIIIANRRHTDLFERGQRNTPFSLAAEIQRRLLPPAFTCEAAEFTVAGWLEPASEVGGDTFDYSVERDNVHLSISDAMGHTVKAAQLATLAVGSLRNSRRSSADVAEQARIANEALCDNANGDEFVSALLIRVQLATGVASVVNAGHPPALLVRDRVVSRLDFEPDLPFGMLRTSTYRAHTLQLAAGDRLLLVTDGMLERNAVNVDVAAALADMVEMHPREVVHFFARAVIAATDGKLQDDATVMCVDWYGPHVAGAERVSIAGASQEFSST